MNKPIRSAFYARVSSQKQADEETIASQLNEIHKRVKRDTLQVDSKFQFCDDGYSGTELLRPALETLRDHVACSMIDRLYIHSPDRLARNFAHQAILLEEFKRHDCEVIFLNQDGLPNSPETNLLIQMQGMIAEYEREKILERTRRGRRHAATAGRVSVFSGAPYGYTYIRKSDGDGQSRWEIDPHTSQHVQLMFELIAHEQMTLSRVCRELASRGIPTRTGKSKWDRATIRGILINPAYYGDAKYGKQRLVPRKPGKRAKRGDPVVPRRAKVMVATNAEEQITISVPAIVSKSLFEQVGHRMEENRKQQRQRQDGPKYLLSGLVVCGQCGSAYCSRCLEEGKYLYYRCIGTDRYRLGEKTICDNTSVKGRELESRVWSEVCQLLRDPQRLTAELERRRESEPQSSSQLLEMQRRVQDLRGRLDRLIDAYATGFLEKSEFESRIVPLRARHDREASAFESLSGTAQSSDLESATSNLERISSEVSKRLSNASESLKRELIELLVKRVEIHQTEIRIVYKVPSRPFRKGPASRGFLQHCLKRQRIAWGVSPQDYSQPTKQPRRGDSDQTVPRQLSIIRANIPTMVR